MEMGTLAPRYTYYGRDIGRRDHRHIRLEDVQHWSRSSCCRIVVCRLWVNRRIRMSLKRVNDIFQLRRKLLLLRAPIM